MSLDKIVHGIGNFTRTVAVSGLLGLGILGAGSVPAYAQQKVKYASNIKTNYIQCRQSANESEGGLPSEALSVLGVLLGSSKDSGDQRTGAVLSTLGAMKHQKEVAMKGRSEININQSVQGESESGKLERFLPAPGCKWANPGGSNDFTVKVDIGNAFVANYWRDKNYDKRPSLDEYEGIKDRFYDNENIILALHDQAGQGITEDLKLEVYDPNGKRVFKKYVVGGKSTSFTIKPALKPGGSKHYRLDWSKKNGGPGYYTIVWRSQGIIEMKKFEIVPASERLEKQ